MKAALFSLVPYAGPAERGVWPVPTQSYSADVAEQSMQASLEQFELADQVGFDWVTVAEHHFAPMSLTPNPMIMPARSPSACGGPGLPSWERTSPS